MEGVPEVAVEVGVDWGQTRRTDWQLARRGGRVGAGWGVEVDHEKDGWDGTAGKLGGGGGVRRRRRRRRCYGEGVVLGVNFLTGIRRGMAFWRSSS